MIKDKHPSYYYENGIELYFFIQHVDGTKTILECKYQSELTEKQRELLDKTVAEKKQLINGVNSLELLKSLSLNMREKEKNQGPFQRKVI